MKTIILGAGMTGLAAGIKTGATIYEALDKPGGICRSYCKNGYVFERGGGHWIFGSNDMRQFIERYDNVIDRERKASVYYNQFLEYPIQTSLSRHEEFNSWSMKGWLTRKFGTELCQTFFYPFNAKYTDGLYDRVIQDDPAKTPDPRGKGYNDTFYYPVNGLDNLSDQMAKKCDIRYGKEAVAIDREGKRVQFKDGEVVEYDRLITTLPLKKTIEMTGDKADDLIYTKVCVLNIGAESAFDTPGYHWVYIPDKDVPFFRVGFYSNVHRDFASPGGVSIYVERALKGGEVEDGYVDYVLHILRKWGWIGQVHVCDISNIEYAYTWVTRDTLRDWYISNLKKDGIESIGRYGKWRFQGISESLMDGLSVTF
jgi:protoporphyrinogen oxidase